MTECIWKGLQSIIQPSINYSFIFKGKAHTINIVSIKDEIINFYLKIFATDGNITALFPQLRNNYLLIIAVNNYFNIRFM